MSEETKGWLIALVIVGFIIVACTGIVYHSNNKAFELGYNQVQKAGTTDVLWVKK